MPDFNAWLFGPEIALHRGRQSLGDAEHHQILQTLDVSQTSGQQILGLRDQVFSDQKINTSEHRAVGHWALRLAVAARLPAIPTNGLPQRFAPNQEDLLPRFFAEDRRVAEFVDALRSGRLQSGSRQPYTTIVHLGIGGSDIGPHLLIDAISDHLDRSPIRAKFLSNLDYHAVQHCLAELDPKTTLVAMVSKSFTTQETLHNAQHLYEWMKQSGITDPFEQFIAITNRTDLAASWGISAEKTFWFDESIGGRYSLWGPVSLTARAVLGNALVDQVLVGGLEMDQHFLATPLHQNLPAVLAATDFYNLRRRHIPTLMVSAYDSRLSLLVPYLKQLWMESLGKHIDRHGQLIDGPACPILWGDIGTNAQHAFFQLLHQGGQGVAVDLIGTVRPEHDATESHQALLANLIAQSQALSLGYESSDPNKSCWGGHPVNLFMLDQLNAKSLGAFICMWEHRVICLAALSGVNPFDQWGVELGKAIASSAIVAMRSNRQDTPAPQSKSAPHQIDATSQSIIDWIKQR